MRAPDFGKAPIWDPLSGATRLYIRSFDHSSCIVDRWNVWGSNSILLLALLLQVTTSRAEHRQIYLAQDRQKQPKGRVLYMLVESR